MKQYENLPPEQSVLQVAPVVFDELSFQREGFQNKGKDVPTKLSVARRVEKLSDGHYRVIVQAIAAREKEYVAKVQVSGFCAIREDLENKDALLNSNALSILFPYIRSQLTLLTAQPETEPIVLPVLNIAKMVEESEKQEESEKT